MGFFSKFHNKDLDALIYLKSGLVKYNENDLEGSIKEFTNGIRAYPNNAHFYLNRGTAYRDYGNDIEAEKDFIKALDLNSRLFLASYRLGIIQFNKGDNRSAIKNLKNAYANFVSAKPGTVAVGMDNIIFVSEDIILGALGDILSKEGEYSESLKYLSKSLEINPNSSNTQLLKGIVLVLSGEFYEGIKFIKRAEELGNLEANMALMAAELMSPPSEIPSSPSVHLTDDNLSHFKAPFIFISSNNMSKPMGATTEKWNHDLTKHSIEIVFSPSIEIMYSDSLNQWFLLNIYSIDSMGKADLVLSSPMELQESSNETIRFENYDEKIQHHKYRLGIYRKNGEIESVGFHNCLSGIDIFYS